MQDEAMGILVVSKWHNQLWYPLFTKLLVREPLVFGPNNNLLVSPYRVGQHPRAAHFQLMAAIVSGGGGVLKK